MVHMYMYICESLKLIIGYKNSLIGSNKQWITPFKYIYMTFTKFPFLLHEDHILKYLPNIEHILKIQIA